MKSIIASLFAIYSITSGNRLLLQGPPSFVTPPVEPAVTDPPATVVTVAATDPPAAVPVTTASFVPGSGLPFALPTKPALPPRERKCIIPYDKGTVTSPTCAGTVMEINNPNTHYKLYCGGVGSCASAQIDFNYFPGHQAERIETIQCSETYSCYNSKVTVNNLMGGNPFLLDKLECKVDGACTGLKVHLNNAVINNVDCAYPRYCPDCEIFTAGVAVGVPCHSLH